MIVWGHQNMETWKLCIGGLLYFCPFGSSFVVIEFSIFPADWAGQNAGTLHSLREYHSGSSAWFWHITRWVLDKLHWACAWVAVRNGKKIHSKKDLSVVLCACYCWWKKSQPTTCKVQNLCISWDNYQPQLVRRGSFHQQYVLIVRAFR